MADVLTVELDRAPGALAEIHARLPTEGSPDLSVVRVEVPDVDTAALFTAVSTVGMRASQHDLLSLLERSPFLTDDRHVAPWLRERATASIHKRSSWALKTASGEEFLDLEPFLSACAELAETEGRTPSYVHGVRTARDTLLCLKDLLDTFLIAPS